MATSTQQDQLNQMQDELTKALQAGKSDDAAAIRRDIARTQAAPQYQMTWQGGTPMNSSTPPPPAFDAGGGRGRISPARTDDPVDVTSQFSPANLAKLIANQSDVLDNANAAQKEATGRAADFNYSAAIATADQAVQQGTVAHQIQTSGNLVAEDPNNLHAQLSAALFQNDQDYSVERTKYDDLAGKSLLDDPLGYIMAQLEMPSQAAKVNALAGKDQQLQSTFERTIQMDADAKRQMTANTVASARDIALQQAQATRADADARIAAITGQGAVTKMQVAATAAAALDRAEMDPINQAIKRAKLAGMDEAEQQRQLQAAQNMRLANVLGLQAPMAEKDFSNLSPALRADAEKAQQTGVVTPELMVELGKGLIGTPRESEYNAAANAIKGIDAEILAVQKAVGNERVSYKEAQQIGRDNYYKGLYNQLNDPKMGTPGMMDKSLDVKQNIYRPNLSSFVQDQVMRANSGVPTDIPANNGLMRMMVQTLKTPGALASNGNLAVANEKQTVQAFADLVAQGKIMGSDGKPMSSSEAASQISDFYKGATSWAAKLNKPQQLGFPVASNYRAELTTPYSDRTTKTDLLSKAELENWLVTYGKERKLLNAPFRGTGFNMFN